MAENALRKFPRSGAFLMASIIDFARDFTGRFIAVLRLVWRSALSADDKIGIDGLYQRMVEGSRRRFTSSQSSTHLSR